MRLLIMIFFFGALVGGTAAAQSNVKAETLTDAVVYSELGGGNVLGVIKKGGRLWLDGVNGEWFYFQFWNQPAWIPAKSINIIQGDRETLPVVGSIRGSIRLIDYRTIPPIPPPGKPFQVEIQIEGAAGSTFGVAADVEGVFIMTPVRLTERMGRVSMGFPPPLKTGWHQQEIILDLERQASPGARGIIRYFVDRPQTNQWDFGIAPYADIALTGDIYDLSWDGEALGTRNGARIGRLTLPLGEVHYDAVGEVSDQVIFPEGGALYGWVGAKGRRGVIRVASVTPLRLNVFIYGGDE